MTPVVSEMSALKEFEKNPNIKPSDIQCIRKWLMQQPHLPGNYITDLDLLLAYHCCECCIETTKKVIDLNYTLRSLFTFYQNRSIDDTLEAALRTWLITPLEATVKKGYRVIYCQLLDPDPQKFVYGDAVRAFVMIMDLWLSEEGTAPGTVIILNMDKVSLGHLSRVDLSIAQQFFYFLQLKDDICAGQFSDLLLKIGIEDYAETGSKITMPSDLALIVLAVKREAMFVRLKEFHFVNAPSFMDILMSMMKPFMKKELLDILRVHQVGSATLEEYFPIAALPKEAGGENKEGALLADQKINKLKENQLFYKDETRKRADESKRPAGPMSINSFFSGLESFKKLEID